MRARSSLVLALWFACRALAAEPAVDGEFRELCAKDAALCADCQAFKTKVSSFIPIKDRDTPALSNPRLSAFNQEFNSLGDRADAMAAKAKLDDAAQKKIILPAFSSLRALLNTVTAASVPKELESLSQALSFQEKALDQLQIDAAGATAPSEGFKARLRAINDAGTAVWKSLQSASLNIDRMGRPTHELFLPGGQRQVALTDAGRLAGDANPLQARVAALSRGIQELDKTIGAGLSWPEADPAAQKKAAESRAKVNDLLADPFAKGGGAALADMKRVPMPEAEPSQRPPIYTGKAGRDSDPQASNRVALLRAARLTKTVGDPAGRAKYVFRQTGETCAIAVQIMVLQELGAAATDDKSRKALEDSLYARAAKDDFFTGSASDPQRRFHGGTPNQYLGDLLGIPLIKHYAAGDDELLKTVSSGKMVMVGVIAGSIWNDPAFANRGHFVAVTGAEINKVTGALLGYYINDTGTNEGARFVTAGQFLDAWHKHSRVFIEPQ